MRRRTVSFNVDKNFFIATLLLLRNLHIVSIIHYLNVEDSDEPWAAEVQSGDDS